MKVSDAVAQWLVERGLRHVFAVSGGANLHILDSIAQRADMRLICTQNEQAAGFAADATARLRGFGCFIVTSGPGATNAFTPLVAAWNDGVPLLLITGNQTRPRLDDYGTRGYGFQALSGIASTYAPYAKFSETVMQEAAVRETLWKAYLAATTPRQGPTVVDIPDDVSRGEC